MEPTTYGGGTEEGARFEKGRRGLQKVGLALLLDRASIELDL